MFKKNLEKMLKGMGRTLLSLDLPKPTPSGDCAALSAYQLPLFTTQAGLW